jgi:hypothetical protein
MLKVSLRDILEHNVLTFKVVPKDLESFYFVSAAESDIPLQVYLYGRCNALSWYLRIPSAFTSIMPLRVVSFRRRLSVVFVVL